MSKVAMEDALQGASTTVLETMFFADVQPAEGTGGPADDAVTCALEYTGAENGRFGVTIDRAALEILARDFYGAEDEVSPGQMNDVACELSNMLAGSTLSRYATERLCVLSSPRICAAQEPADESLAGELLSRFAASVEGGHLLVWCTLKAAA